MHACIRKAFVESREVYLQNNDPPGRGGGARGVGKGKHKPKKNPLIHSLP